VTSLQKTTVALKVHLQALNKVHSKLWSKLDYLGQLHFSDSSYICRILCTIVCVTFLSGNMPGDWHGLQTKAGWTSCTWASLIIQFTPLVRSDEINPVKTTWKLMYLMMVPFQIHMEFPLLCNRRVRLSNHSSRLALSSWDTIFTTVSIMLQMGQFGNSNGTYNPLRCI
jgi:hypothetical protein